MRQIRAIVLLIVYTAFTASAAFGKHVCTNFCTPASMSHNAHQDANVPPAECSEKEVVNIQQLEHRSGTVIKMILSGASAAHKKPPEFTEVTPRTENNYHTITSPALAEVPLYISLCVFRL